MPFINLKTNVSVPQDKENQIKSQLGQAVTAIPGKSENWLMVGIEPDYKLWFKGDASPCAMVEVSVYGKASSSDYNKLTAEICSIVENQLGISPSRTYVKYAETMNWGWNGNNF